MWASPASLGNTYMFMVTYEYHINVLIQNNIIDKIKIYILQEMLQ